MRGHDDFLANVGKKSISRFGLLWLMSHDGWSWPTARRATRNFFTKTPAVARFDGSSVPRTLKREGQNGGVHLDIGLVMNY